MTWCPAVSCLASDLEGRTIVSVLTKRTYAIGPDGHTVVADEQLPLDTSEDPPQAYDPTWRGELDVAPYKVATDVVVFGRAYAPGGSCTQMQIEVALPQHQRASRLLVTGDRRCSWRSDGTPAVSKPAAFETMPLGYDRAYGGVDPSVEHPSLPRDIEEALAQLMSAPGAYPRNSVGRGYVVHNRPELIDGLLLPNIERVDSLLRPERIVVGDHARWHRQPLPGGFGWFDVGWFPRCVFAGALPNPPAPADVAEAVLGFLPQDHARRFRATPEGLPFDHRLFSGASLGLAVPYLRGDEILTARGLTVSGDFALRLPGDRPNVLVRHAGRLLTVQCVPHTVALLVDERLVSLVWRASAVLPPSFEPRMPTYEHPDATGLEDLEIVLS